MIKHYAYIGLILALLAFGYWAINKADQSGYDRATAEWQDKELEELKAEREAKAELEKINSRLSADLASAQRKINHRERTIRELERDYETIQQSSNQCNFTIGSVMLHNAALGYNYDSGELETAGRTISTVTGSAFISHCNGLASEFERQRVQLNSLIQAVEP